MLVVKLFFWSVWKLIVICVNVSGWYNGIRLFVFFVFWIFVMWVIFNIFFFIVVLVLIKCNVLGCILMCLLVIVVWWVVGLVVMLIIWVWFWLLKWVRVGILVEKNCWNILVDEIICLLWVNGIVVVYLGLINVIFGVILVMFSWCLCFSILIRGLNFDGLWVIFDDNNYCNVGWVIFFVLI